jgi:CRP-like cAMP-binding protein
MMSPGPDTMIQSAMDRRSLPALFALLPFLRDLSAGYLADIAGQIEWFSLPAGWLLFEAGDPPDGLYVVINGAVAPFNAESASVRLGTPIQAREVFGEIELLMDVPGCFARSAGSWRNGSTPCR